MISILANPPEDINKDIIVPNSADPEYVFTYSLSAIQPTKYEGGTVKIADSRNFKVAKNIAAAEVSVDVGGMRYIHLYFSWYVYVLIESDVTRELHVCASSSTFELSLIITTIVASYTAWVDIYYQRKGENHSLCGTKRCEHVWFLRECLCIQLKKKISSLIFMPGRRCCLYPTFFRWVLLCDLPTKFHR